MQKNSNVTIALIAFVLTLTMVSASLASVAFAQTPSGVVALNPVSPNKNPFVQTGPAGHPLASEPNKRSYYNPIPAFQMYESYTGPQPAPSPWYCGASSNWGRYNSSNNNYNDYSTAPTTAHIRWIQQYQPGVIGYTHQEWDYNFKVGPRNQLSDAYSGMIAFGGYVVCWMDESNGAVLQAYDEWNGQRVWQTKMDATVGDQPVFIINAAGGPNIVVRNGGFSGTYFLQYSLQTGNFVGLKNFTKACVVDLPGAAVQMYYNSSRFGAVSIGETELYAPGGVVYVSVFGGPISCYSWSNPNQKIWGPTYAAGGVNTLVETDQGPVLCGADMQAGYASGIDAITGELLWTNALVGGSHTTQGGGYGMFYCPSGSVSFQAFDARTGELVWKNANITASYWNEFFINVGDGKVCCCNRDGNIYCLDAFTGDLAWSFFAGPSPYNPWRDYYGVYGFHIVGVGGGSPAWGTGRGVYYAAVGDESIGTVPSVPGNYMYAVDMESGNLLWKYPGGAFSHNQLGAVFDGLAAMWDPVMGQVVCFGKGDTKIDLSVGSTQIPMGGYTYILGRITDQSPAHPDTPCVSKDSMEAWMSYLHSGYSQPPAELITGVPVQLLAVDESNNVISLGNVTSDSQGYFSLKWTPPNTEAKYRITASFSEDESYYSSWAVTDLIVDSAAGSASSGAASTAAPVGVSMATIALAAIVIVSISVNVAVLLKVRRQKRVNNQ